MNKYFILFCCILLTLTIGSISGIATASNINNWYVFLKKPFFNPPNYLFAPVWTLLYTLMGISFFLILQSPISIFKRKAIIIFVIQLTLNFIWSFIFFKYHLLGFAFIEIILIWIAVLLMILKFYKINHLSGLLLIPYLLWVSFATALNGAIWWLN